MNSEILPQPIAAPSPPPKRPSTLRISIGGFFGSNCSLTYEGNLLKYGRDEHQEGAPIEAVITPSDDEWATFRNELDAVGIWDWDAEYDDPDVCDGTQWEVEIKWGRLERKTYGSNRYPGDAATPEDSQPFTRFLRAVSSLAGGRTFE